MIFKQGEKVRYLNAVGGGVVRRIINDILVEILDDNGFIIPVAVDELIKDKTSNIVSPQKDVLTDNKIVPSEDITIEGKDNASVYIAFLPLKTGNVEMYIINDCNLSFSFNISLVYKDTLTSVCIEIAEPNTKVLAKEILQVEVNSGLDFLIQGFFFSAKSYKYVDLISETVRINAKSFSGSNFIENDFFDESVLLIELTDSSNVEEKETNHDFSKILAEKENSSFLIKKQSTNSKALKNSLKEVDLHIHELVENENGLTPKDKLDIQIKTFRDELKKALSDKISKIVFIHGVGSGVLKLKISNILDKEYPRLKYQDASFEKYKFGATLVILR